MYFETLYSIDIDGWMLFVLQQQSYQGHRPVIMPRKSQWGYLEGSRVGLQFYLHIYFKLF